MPDPMTPEREGRERTPEWRAAAVKACCMSLDLERRLQYAISAAHLGDAYMAIETARKIAEEIEAVAIQRLKRHMKATKHDHP